ncbi:MAG TPA: universal stress protein [Gaiellaceae bacterium]|nr:universal stress protein [Gaiellaceae bacterium]
MYTNASVPGAGRERAQDAVFGHVLVGLDDTPESLLAAAQAGVLRAPDGRLELLAVAERHLAAHAGMAAPDAEEHVYADTAANLERAKELVDADEAVLAAGRLVPLLRLEAERRGATLIAVGARSHRRLAALALGGHDVEALHDAPCSVLLARPGWGPHRPDRIVVAIDGSPESRAAEETARALAARLGCDLVPAVGLADAAAPDVLRAERENGLVDPRPLLDAVAEAATAASLVVVGRRAPRRGRRADLAERAAYRVRCSVLVVRHHMPAQG